jgi:hypothetical protein
LHNLAKKYDYIIFSRFLSKSNIKNYSKIRSIGNLFFIKLTLFLSRCSFSDPGNAIYCISFELFNKLKFSLLSSSMLTLMLTLLPWHFQRALWHPEYAMYAVVPIFIIFLLIFTDYYAESTKHKVLKLTALLMLISTFEPYYWVFVEILLVAIFILFAITQRFSLKKNLNNLYYLSIIPFLQLIELLIQRNQSTYPLLSSPLERIYGYAEKYSGSFIALFLPSPISLIPFFSKLRLKFDQLSTLSLGEAGPWNSLLGSLAIIFCLILAIYLMITNVKYAIYLI